MNSLYLISNYLISNVQNFDVNNLSLLKIIFSDSLLNTVIFYRNVYTNFSVFKASRYNINLTFLINQSTTVKIKLYKTSVSNFSNNNNLIIKFITINIHD